MVARFVQPLAKYQRYITDDLEPLYIDDEIAVLGINTARSLTIKGGRINAEQIARVRVRLGHLDACLVKVVVTHQPFDLPPHLGVDDLVGRAPLAIRQFGAWVLTCRSPSNCTPAR